MQPLTNTRTTIIARLSGEIETLSTRRKTPQNRENLRRLRGERTAYERGSRMPPMMGTERNYSAPYAYIVTLICITGEDYFEREGVTEELEARTFKRDVTILSERRLTLKQVKHRAFQMAEMMQSIIILRVIVEAALHHA